MLSAKFNKRSNKQKDVTSLILNFDSGINDLNGRTITTSGNIVVQGGGAFGNCVNFGGGYFTIANSALGSNNFTLEGFFSISRHDDRTLWTYPGGLGLFADAALQKRIYIGGSILLQPSPGFQLNTLLHIAVVRNQGTITGYVNGVSFGSFVNSSNFSQTDLRIGTGLYNNFDGYLHGLKLSWQALYTTNFTPTIAQFTI